MLANITVEMLKKTLQDQDLAGLYHVVPGVETSWYDYANYVINSSNNLGEVFLLQNAQMHLV